MNIRKAVSFVLLLFWASVFLRVSLYFFYKIYTRQAPELIDALLLFLGAISFWVAKRNYARVRGKSATALEQNRSSQ